MPLWDAIQSRPLPDECPLQHVSYLASSMAGITRGAVVEAIFKRCTVAVPKPTTPQQEREGTRLQFLTSWSVLLGLAIVLMALAFLIEPAIPFRTNGQLTEVAELAF